MKIKRILILVSLFSVICISCGKTCRCYRYDGNVDEFDMEDLNTQGISCEGMEETDFGLRYSLCERVSF